MEQLLFDRGEGEEGLFIFLFSKLTFTSSKSTTEMLEKGIKDVQS